MRGLRQKVAIVTGAARGIGAATAQRLADEGVKVLLTDVLSAEGEAMAQLILDRGGEAAYAYLDVSDEANWERVVRSAVERFGAIHILVNNAGIGTLPDVEQETLDGFNRTIAINQVGVWLGMKYTIPQMRASGGGSIINISSIFGTVGGFGGSIAYHAAKGAVRLMTKNAAVRYAKENIRVNSVHPGFIDTPMISQVKDSSDPAMQQMMSTILGMTPMGRLGKPEEIAAMVAFLASDDAAFCTGAEFYVDGGWTAI
ncbi:MAG: 2,5-dichloro-2,5-cyclohexadiene-1,4-diol dehydrogenase [Meiothermus sp.]|nr:MAG: 2,5-dichloro-2,5-cyclohexadiene-1,4-diol dehydrogenase [Meiothermus sp.]